MALTPSTMLKLGTSLPPFKLKDPETGAILDSSIIPASSKGVLIAVICNHCPYVIHINDCFAALAKEFMGRGIFTLAVSANDVEKYPQDSPDNMRRDKTGYDFPYLYDESQEFAKALAAACTPDFFLFTTQQATKQATKQNDNQQRLVYRGQFDSSRPGSDTPVTGKDLRAAMVALLNSEPISEQQMPSMGCGIKWIKGNEPAYA